MSRSASRTSRVFTISFPEELAREVVAIADKESRNISELFREAFRTYQMERTQRRRMATRRIAAERRSRQGPEDKIERVADKTRDE